MTTKTAETVDWVNKIVRNLAWVACAALLNGLSNTVNRIDEKLEVIKSVQDVEHATFKAIEQNHTDNIRSLQEQVRAIQYKNRMNEMQESDEH